jgi:hypothetical protein
MFLAIFCLRKLIFGSDPKKKKIVKTKQKRVESLCTSTTLFKYGKENKKLPMHLLANIVVIQKRILAHHTNS